MKPIFFYPKFFLDQYLFWHKLFLHPQYFMDPQFLLTQNFFSDQRFFGTLRLPLETRDKAFPNWKLVKFMLVNQSKQGFNRGQKSLCLLWAWHSSAQACLYFISSHHQHLLKITGLTESISMFDIMNLLECSIQFAGFKICTYRQSIVSFLSCYKYIVKLGSKAWH